MLDSSVAMTLRLSVLGHTEIEGSEGVERLYQQPRLLLLLSYLVLAPARVFLRREQVAAAFWPDQSDDRARSSLRSALYQLRTLLGAEVVLSRGDDIAIDGAMVACDAQEFMDALRNDHLARALELYRGPLLEGVTPHSAELQHWLDEQRESYRAATAPAVSPARSSNVITRRMRRSSVLASFAARRAQRAAEVRSDSADS